MPELPPRPITKSGPKKVGRPLGSVPSNKLPSQLPDMAGRLFGRMMVVSGEVVRKQERGKPHVLVECQGCQTRSLRDYSNLMAGKAGCRSCAKPQQAPDWLVKRAISAKQRCTNPKNASFHRYGGRGIRFEFQSPTAMAVWVQETLGLHPDLELDRINNDGPYAPGNLRLISGKLNMMNRDNKRPTRQLHAFRLAHPEITYADATLVRMFSEGLTTAQIVERFASPSAKPRGVYGTFSTPDLDILSLSKDC